MSAADAPAAVAVDPAAAAGEVPAADAPAAVAVHPAAAAGEVPAADAPAAVAVDPAAAAGEVPAADAPAAVAVDPAAAAGRGGQPAAVAVHPAATAGEVPAADAPAAVQWIQQQQQQQRTDPAAAAPVDLAAGDVNVAARQTTDYSVSQPVHQQELQGFWRASATPDGNEPDAAKATEHWAAGSTAATRAGGRAATTVGIGDSPDDRDAVATGAGDWRAADADAEGAATGGGADAAPDTPAVAATTPIASTDVQRASEADGSRAQSPQAGSGTAQSLVKQTAQRHQAHS